MSDIEELKGSFVNFVQCREKSFEYLHIAAMMVAKSYGKNRKAFYENINTMQAFVLLGLTPEDQALYEKSGKLKGKLSRKENKELSLARIRIQSKITYYIEKIDQASFQDYHKQKNAIQELVDDENRKKEELNNQSNKKARIELDDKPFSKPQTTEVVNLSDEPEPEFGIDSNQLQVIDQPIRNKHANSSTVRRDPQDLYQTDAKAIAQMIHRLVKFVVEVQGRKPEDCVVFNPCHGHGNITKALEEQGFKVIIRDKYTLPVSHDYFVDEDPKEYFDFVITNPPWYDKLALIKKVLSYPFETKVILLLLTDELSTVHVGSLLMNQDYHIDVLSPPPMFLNEGVWKPVGACGWYYFNFPPVKSNISVKICDYRNVDLDCLSISGDQSNDSLRSVQIQLMTIAE